MSDAPTPGTVTLCLECGAEIARSARRAGAALILLTVAALMFASACAGYAFCSHTVWERMDRIALRDAELDRIQSNTKGPRK